MQIIVSFRANNLMVFQKFDNELRECLKYCYWVQPFNYGICFYNMYIVELERKKQRDTIVNKIEKMCKNYKTDITLFITPIIKVVPL
jgi:hypothetical protein